ncbi:hypothetical protein SEA_TYPHA_98 [Mycobacterium phage Typha]|uniref:Uncharacterized protein n=1 Tax=Mycobacterium phage Typha TaxID=2517971 RepID=A0A482J861_9CAUD|nr:hypothetical protein KCH40_gp071 [Mycobacterium phage Typha]QBP29753.1 hypothetical protein SEA_TYPHA_98 [Mycobacterium phage Typha]
MTDEQWVPDEAWRRTWQTAALADLDREERAMEEIRQRAGSTAPQRNPEQSVIDAIDALVNESLEAGPRDDYNKPYAERCPQCDGPWHGLKRGDCPGATGIEGRPDEDAKREGDVFAPDYDSGSNPLASYADHMERYGRAMGWLTSPHHVPPDQRPPHGPDQYPYRQRFAVHGDRVIHVDSLPGLSREVQAAQWDRDDMTMHVVTLDVVEIKCRVTPCLEYPIRSYAWTFEVYSNCRGETHRTALTMTREFLVSVPARTPVTRVPLVHLGVDGELRVMEGGTVVLVVPMGEVPDVVLGFLGQAGR